MIDVPEAPRAFVSWAHDPNDGVERDGWIRQVYALTNAARKSGIDADVDLFHLQDLGINWAHYGPTRIRQSEFVIIAINRAWKERFQGENSPREGAGAAAEANALHGMFAADQAAMMRKVIIVVLPGASAHDVPEELRPYQRVQIDEISETGLTSLLRLIYRAPEYKPAALGPRPRLAPLGSPVAPTSVELDRATALQEEEPRTDHAEDENAIPGLAKEGQAEVSRLIDRNPHGDLIMSLLASVTAWPGVRVRGKRNQKQQTVEYNSYLSLAMPDKSTFGYVWPRRGVVNPRSLITTSTQLADIADRAEFLPQKVSARFPVRLDVVDQQTLEQALAMLAVARDETG